MPFRDSRLAGCTNRGFIHDQPSYACTSSSWTRYSTPSTKILTLFVFDNDADCFILCNAGAPGADSTRSFARVGKPPFGQSAQYSVHCSRPGVYSTGSAKQQISGGFGYTIAALVWKCRGV